MQKHTNEATVAGNGPYGADERQRLIRLVKEKAFKKGHFILSSGRESSYYFNSKNILLTPEGAYLAARAIMEKIIDLPVDAVGGAVMGAVPMAGSLAVVAHLAGRPEIKFFMDRKEAKKHGDSRRIEGPALKDGARVVVIDDVVTTGGSALGTALHLREEGCRILKVVALLDRLEGAAAAFNKENIELDPVLTINDLQ